MCDDLVQDAALKLYQRLTGLTPDPSTLEKWRQELDIILLDLMRASNKVVIIVDGADREVKLISQLPVRMSLIQSKPCGPFVTTAISEIMIPEAQVMTEQVHDTLVAEDVMLPMEQMQKLAELLN